MYEAMKKAGIKVDPKWKQNCTGTSEKAACLSAQDTMFFLRAFTTLQK